MAIGWLQRYLEQYRDTGDMDAAGLPAREPSQERPTSGSLANLRSDIIDQGRETSPETNEQVELLLGRGTGRRRAMGLGGMRTVGEAPYQRLVTRRGNKFLEGHRYKGGETRYFERKDPRALEASYNILREQPGGPNAGMVDDAVLNRLQDPDLIKRVRMLMGR